MNDLLCISHLRWDFVWQRPQHLLSRLAQHYRVLYVEEPITSEAVSLPTLDVHSETVPGEATIAVARLVIPAAKSRRLSYGAAYSQQLLRYLTAERYQNPILWLCTPMALDFVPVIPHCLLVYDVMDQLSTFQGAPKRLAEREVQLLQQAHVVFTGGVSLYHSKRHYNPNTHLFPGGVEIEHFARAAAPHAFERPADLQGVEGPILGYLGVIDERMDLPLLAYLAENRPDWQIVLVGPVAKLTGEALPRAANILYCGPKDYTELPVYLAHFDAALIPFALNTAAEYVSSTKTLEYMAAHKPIVSTAIPDVIKLYGEVVRIGHSPAEFLAQIEAALTEPPSESRIIKEKRILTQNGWNSIAQQMYYLMQVQLELRARKAEHERPILDYLGADSTAAI